MTGGYVPRRSGTARGRTRESRGFSGEPGERERPAVSRIIATQNETIDHRSRLVVVYRQCCAACETAREIQRACAPVVRIGLAYSNRAGGEHVDIPALRHGVSRTIRRKRQRSSVQIDRRSRGHGTGVRLEMNPPACRNVEGRSRLDRARAVATALNRKVRNRNAESSVSNREAR